MSRSANLGPELDVTVVIISYNTREMTLECIRSVIEQTSSVRYEIIVVDNNSADGSADAIRENFRDVKLIASTKNLGFGRANNLAAHYARGNRILLLNPDTVILRHAIDRLHQFAIQNPECRIWGGRTVFADGSLNPQSCWRRMTLWSVFCSAVGLSRLKGAIFNTESYGGWNRDTARAVDIVSGCFFLTDRAIWEQLQGLDPTFFMYGEEADFCLRAHKLGAQPMVTPTATIIHYGGVSEPDQADKQIKLLAGKMTLMKRHWSRLSLLIGKFLFRVLPLTRRLIYGSAAVLFGNPNFQHQAQLWRQVWQCRQRWVSGWQEMNAPLENDDSTRFNLQENAISNEKPGAADTTK